MTHYRLAVTTTGSAGSATGSATTEEPVRGILGAIKIDYHASAPATTDVTVAETGNYGRTLLTRSNSATDGTFYPAAQQHDTSAATVTSYTPFIISGEYITVSLAQCDALTNAAIVYLQTLE